MYICNLYGEWVIPDVFLSLYTACGFFNVVTAKCKNIDRLMNFPTTPMFGCKQPFLVRPCSLLRTTLQAPSIFEATVVDKQSLLIWYLGKGGT